LLYIHLQVAYFLFNFTKKGAESGVTLREQAAGLLDLRLWGIGAKTPNRDRLSAGDRILAFVGAPERLFVGHGILSSGVHDWSPEEGRIYPEHLWRTGVAFSQTEVWDEPVPLKSVWPNMPSSAKNPEAHFFAGVMQVRQKDYETVLAERGGPPPETGAPGGAEPAAPETMVDRLYATTEKLKEFLASSSVKQITEEATRALFIDRYLQALGYTDFDDIDYGVQVESKDFADYVLSSGGEAAMVVEAKRLGADLGAQQAAQVIKYSSVLGIRWGLLTDGRTMKLYDRAPNASAEKRLVYEVDLADYSDREDFEVSIYPDLALLSKQAMANGSGLARRATQEAVRDLLTTSGSESLAVLKGELASKNLAQIDTDELAQLLSELLG
jgi:hypothetical protein